MEPVLAYCSHLFTSNGNLFISIFMAGFVGSLTHCSTMCGPIAAAQTAILPPDTSSSRHRLLLYYHAGRITTYMTLGVIVTASSQQLFAHSWFPVISGVLLLSAGILFIFSALKPNATHACSSCGHTGFLSNMIDSLRIPVYFQLYLRGIMLGLMPCGLVIAALLLVSTTHDVLAGGSAMLLFGLATAPVLQIIGYGTHQMVRRWKPAMAMAGRSAMTANGVMLCALGINIL